MPKRGVIGMSVVALAAYLSGRRQGLQDGETRGYGLALRAFVAGRDAR